MLLQSRGELLYCFSAATDHETWAHGVNDNVSAQRRLGYVNSAIASAFKFFLQKLVYFGSFD
jgi:hypothetical protein